MTDRSPSFELDIAAFMADPYPQLAALRAHAPVAWVPALNAWLISHRDVIHREEKRVEVFSSVQPDGLMTRLMGQNMMRKDGEAHRLEREAIRPSVSPATVKARWRERFVALTESVLDDIAPRGRADLVADFALPVAAETLKILTGLVDMRASDMDRVSQGMIDGCANYAGDPAVERHARDCVEAINRHVTARLPMVRASPDYSLLSVQDRAGIDPEQNACNIRLAISGGQNETRDAIAGTAWALLSHPEAMAAVRAGEAAYADAFAEYARWQSPIGMSPRELAQAWSLCGAQMQAGDRVFLMFGSANRDESHFVSAERFDIHRDQRAAIPFGAGPHFCAGAWVARCLIAEVALPLLFERLPQLRLDGAVELRGWAFRGPMSVPVRWTVSG